MENKYYKKDDFFLIRRKKTPKIGVGIWGSYSNRLYLEIEKIDELRDFLTSLILFIKYKTPLPLPQKFLVGNAYNDFLFTFDAEKNILNIKETNEVLTQLKLTDILKLKQYLNKCVHYFLYELKINNALPF